MKTLILLSLALALTGCGAGTQDTRRESAAAAADRSIAEALDAVLTAPAPQSAAEEQCPAPRQSPPLLWTPADATQTPAQEGSR